MLYAAIEQVPAPEQVDPDSLSRYYAKFDEKFFSFCDKELAKINTFYSGFEQHLWFCLTPSLCVFTPIIKLTGNDYLKPAAISSIHIIISLVHVMVAWTLK